MKACMIAYTFYEVDYRVRRYAEALVSMGHEVDMIALRRDGEPKHGLLNGVKIDRIQKRGGNENGLFSYIFRSLLFFLRVTLILSLKHRKKSYKLIHVHNPPELLVFAAFIPKLFGAKIILDMHENVPEFYESKFHKGSSDTPLTKSLLFIERISTNYADHVIAAHDLLKERIIRRDGIPEENCMALLNYPNVVGSPESTSNNLEFRIIYPGTISYRHGVDILIRALALVKNQLPGVRLDFYSNQRKDKYWHFLNRLIDDLGVRDNVLFYNPIKSEELGKILRNATFGIVPKRAGNFESEAFSSKILDFMTAGIPIIASRTKIDEFYFDDSMIMFFEPENHQDLGKCMLDLYKNPEKGKWLVNNANEFIKTNNWGIKKKTYFNLVNRLIK